MSAAPAVAEPAAKMLIRGLPESNYPTRPEAESRLVQVLREVAVSFDHARAIVAVFEQRCPTPAELREQAARLREHYDKQPDRRAEWERQYGPPDPTLHSTMLAVVAAPEGSEAFYVQVRRSSIRHALDYIEARLDERGRRGRETGSAQNRNSSWSEFLTYCERCHPEEVEIVRSGSSDFSAVDEMERGIRLKLGVRHLVMDGRYFQAKRDLGYPLNKAQQQLVDGYERANRKPTESAKPAPAEVTA